ncbi:hypothetical protein MNBD_NITROSPINAE04-2072 [hydrothermal vent metagenome]|uniref:Putative zinc-ribbon domain-containing protein n=1 Tax=hydrothermal vent metagenome TaxID=652676 RepID=A0A3B1CHA1_9ZZZZ
MALIKCPECGAQISELARTCPKCGYAFGAIAVKVTDEKRDEIQGVVVTDINMTFSSMVSFMIKWALATIPAAIILAGIFFFLTGFFAWLMAHM